MKRRDALPRPAPDFSDAPLITARIEIGTILHRISWYSTDEPFFSDSAANRFGPSARLARRKRFRTTYVGLSLAAAIGETVLRSAVPDKRRFRIPATDIDGRFALQIVCCRPLVLADLTGEALKSHGGDARVTSTTDYRCPQAWAAAIHAHPDHVDGILYQSRHINTEQAAALFDRCQRELKAINPEPLGSRPEHQAVLRRLRIERV